VRLCVCAGGPKSIGSGTWALVTISKQVGVAPQPYVSRRTHHRPPPAYITPVSKTPRGRPLSNSKSPTFSGRETPSPCPGNSQRSSRKPTLPPSPTPSHAHPPNPPLPLTRLQSHPPQHPALRLQSLRRRHRQVTMAPMLKISPLQSLCSPRHPRLHDRVSSS